MKTICFNCRLQQYITKKDNGHTSFLFFFLPSLAQTHMDRQAYTCVYVCQGTLKEATCVFMQVTHLFVWMRYFSLSRDHAFSSINSIIRPETSCVPFIKSRKDLSTLVSFLLIFLLLLVCVQIYMLLGFFVLLFCSICAWCLLGLHKLCD